MPIYYFHPQDDETMTNSDGTELVDLSAARVHAAGVARELTSSGRILKQDWSEWTLSVRDELGTELFSFAMSELGDGNSEKKRG